MSIPSIASRLTGNRNSELPASIGIDMLLRRELRRTIHPVEIRLSRDLPELAPPNLPRGTPPRAVPPDPSVEQKYVDANNFDH